MLSLFNKLLKRELRAPETALANTLKTQPRTYYVNAFNCKNSGDEPVRMIGLFDSNNWSGLPGLAKSLGNEYYIGVKLLAFYRTKPYRYIVDFYSRCGPVKMCGKQYDKIPIISRYKEQRLEAESPEAAIEKFIGFEFE